ncbi:arsenite-activated ATPase ArsA [Natrinema pellirubrum DSM 15624]|uniref:Arsenite-activated ATPase ArsA n=1 Tax=Natrinema pellirubrum (strain DSM 15624 / CIP 106293 / JCM 10476 / NCIMB 786 / 157) TaxID=797303 RepID=L0JHQ9_NATP1|nr:TRC40/GET3/ArsA family transport-energizing ATPase [Natrinema pellirubrum]AGB30112.1 arsenite-activated ATPase ArsA [Natrinema pellirubrum DSM 15624]ELY69816.1 arsenite-activated ATPase ArsA [Natrinema pellirubrum DSM 15624]
MTDCIFYGGKGGVGKTTCAAATALRLADAGRDTLVVSTDPAHSLSDSLETDLGPEPRELEADAAGIDAASGSLWAVEIDPDARTERYERLARALAADLRSAGIRLDDEEVGRLFAGGAPAGSDEIAALDLLVEYVDDGDWDVVVFDTAPTGHTLRLFDTPEVMGLVLETAQSLRGQAKRIGDAARTAVLGPMSMFGSGRDDEESLESFRARLERARQLLTDPERTEFRVVLLPESMAIAESERLVATLREADVRVDRLVVNRVFEDPEDGCSRCQSRHDRHLERVAEIRETFPDCEVVTLPEREGEVQGLETLLSVGDRLRSER